MKWTSVLVLAVATESLAQIAKCQVNHFDGGGKKKPREKIPKHLRVDSQYKMMLLFMKAKVRSCTSLQLT